MPNAGLAVGLVTVHEVGCVNWSATLVAGKGRCSVGASRGGVQVSNEGKEDGEGAAEGSGGGRWAAGI